MAWPRRVFSSDLGVLILLALARLALHLLTDGQYGFHRDELATLDEARALAWGYVAYPPLAPFVARLALEPGDFIWTPEIFIWGTSSAVAGVLADAAALQLTSR